MPANEGRRISEMKGALLPRAPWPRCQSGRRLAKLWLRIRRLVSLSVSSWVGWLDGWMDGCMQWPPVTYQSILSVRTQTRTRREGCSCSTAVCSRVTAKRQELPSSKGSRADRIVARSLGGITNKHLPHTRRWTEHTHMCVGCTSPRSGKASCIRGPLDDEPTNLSGVSRDNYQLFTRANTLSATTTGTP